MGNDSLPLVSATPLIYIQRSYTFPDSGLQFEWSERKADANRTKHGVSFLDATHAWMDPSALLVPTPRGEEARAMLIGTVGAVVLSVVHVARHGRIRLISARLASRQERRRYAQDAAVP